MRLITALVLAGVFVLAACSAAATVTPSVGLTMAPTVAPTAAPTVVAPTPAPTDVPASPTANELLSGVRSDLQAACAPLQTGLPPPAIAGVTCKPRSDVVDRVTLYLFGTQQDQLDAYATWLTAHKIPPRTNGGRCLVGRASEGGYVPGDDQGIVVVERGGCYLDASGKAHYLATLTPNVLAAVDGKVGDIAAVEGWAWRGNQDAPGAPTVWRSNDE